MRSSSEAALALAGQLRSLTDPQLADLLLLREVRPAGIDDFFDLADALLDAESIARALAQLDRPTLAVLAVLAYDGAQTIGDVAGRLTRLGTENPQTDRALEQASLAALVLRDADRVSLPQPIAEQLLAWPSTGLPSLEALASDPAPATLVPVSGTDTEVIDRASAEHGFTTTTAIAELIAELDRESARELVRGGLALPDTKRLAAAMSIDVDRVAGLLDIAERAGLVALDRARWLATAASADWLVDSSEGRWAALAGAWLDRLPPDVRSVLANRAHATWGERLDDYVAWLYPAGGEWMHDRIRVYTRDAELLGITATHVPSTPGAALLTSGTEDAAAAMAALFPPGVDRVYLQHDLTVVSPGPLEPAIDARLRTIADVESRALASTYRVSTASLYRGFAAGETKESIHAFLQQISLTGIPQPLDYLLTESASRYGLVRVAATPDGRSIITSTDDAMLRTLLVDSSLGSLSLTRAASGLASRFDRDVVFWSLSEARYPVAAEDENGSVVVLRRRRAERVAPVAPVAAAPGLIEKLRVGSSADPDVTGAAWLERQLDVAIRGKLALTVTVEMPNGSSVEYQLEPASVSRGRLRARDRAADIERTLPLTSITAIAPPKP